jgi:hypothetical protein
MAAAAGLARRLCPKRGVYLWPFVAVLLAAGFVPSLVSLRGLKSRALRRGVWLRARPAARALIDAAILYLRRGGRIRSPALVEALRRAAEEVLRLAAPVRVLARAVGYAIARRLGVEVDEEKALALGLQWLNTPRRWRRDVATP